MKTGEIGGNTDTGLLKMIALISMITDHVGAKLLPDVIELRIIGRIALPLYAWCLVVGAVYTRDIWKYAGRILLVGLISQPCYMLGLDHTLDKWNIYATLLFGLLGIIGIRKKRFGSQFWAPALCVLVPCVFIDMDYGWKGVLFILLLYLARKDKGAIIAAMTAFCLFWGNGSGTVNQVFGIQLQNAAAVWPWRAFHVLFSTNIAASFLKLQALALLALPLLAIPAHTGVRFPKWAAYAAYPGHLLLLWAVRRLFF